MGAFRPSLLSKHVWIMSDKMTLAYINKLTVVTLSKRLFIIVILV